MSSHKSKSPVENRLPVSIWKAKQRENDFKILELAKQQEKELNKKIKYLLKN